MRLATLLAAMRRGWVWPISLALLVGHALMHHHDAVGDRQRLFLVVGDEDRGDAQPRWIARISSRSDTRILASSADSGSSSSSTRGLGASARASATRCCWPPDIWNG
jgi:hypothetical protein